MTFRIEPAPLIAGPAAVISSEAYMAFMFQSIAIRHAFIVALSLVASVSFAQVEVTPRTPKPQESVRVQVASFSTGGVPTDEAKRRITMAGNKITIELRRLHGM
jgi:hypothetical protein